MNWVLCHFLLYIISYSYLDKGLVGTKMGEIVKLIIHADFAYGSGSHGNIPPNSTLIFEVKL